MKKVISIILVFMLSVVLLTPAYAAGQTGQALLSKIVVADVKQSTSNPDEIIKVTVTLQNLNPQALKQVMVGVSGLSANTLSLTNTFGPFAVDFESEGFGDVTFDLYASPDIKGGNYPLSLTLTYVDTEVNGFINEYYTVSDTRSISILIDSKTVHTEMPQIIVTSYNIGRDYLNSGEKFVMNYTLKNTSANLALTNVMLNLSSDSNAYAPVSGISNQLFIGEIAAGGSYSGAINLKANSSLPSGTYNIILGFQYQDIYSNTYTSTAAVSVQLIGKTTAPEKTPLPQVVVTSYDIGSEQVLGGDEFEMTIVLKNTSADTADNVLLDFASDANAFISAPGVPNQIYAGKIAAGESYTGVLKMKANDSLMSGTYNLNIGLQYQDSAKNSYSSATYITIELEQKQKLSINKIKVPDTVIVNTKALLTVNYENPGIDDLKNLVMNISGNIADNEKTVSIGAVKAGSSGNIDQFITPKTAGSQEIKVSFTFEDSAGNSYTTPNSVVTLSVQSNESAVNNSNNPSDVTDSGSQNSNTQVLNLNQYWVYFVIAGVVLVLAAAGIMWRVRNLKKKKKPEWSRTGK